MGWSGPWGFIYPLSRLGVLPKHGGQSLSQFQGSLLLITPNTQNHRNSSHRYRVGMSPWGFPGLEIHLTRH